jgi:hypothetical protein
MTTFFATGRKDRAPQKRAYMTDDPLAFVIRIPMPGEIADREKVANAVLDKVKHFTIGFALAGPLCQSFVVPR